MYIDLYLFIPPGEVDVATSMSLVYHCPLLSHLLVPRWTMILSKFYPDPSSKAWGSPTVKDRTDLQEFLFPQAICQITIAQVALLQGCLPRATNGYSEASWDLMSSLKIMEKHLKKLRSNHAIWSNSVNPAAETKNRNERSWELLTAMTVAKPLGTYPSLDSICHCLPHLTARPERWRQPWWQQISSPGMSRSRLFRSTRGCCAADLPVSKYLLQLFWKKIIWQIVRNWIYKSHK